MAGIHVFAFLVGCAPNLMACEQIPTNGLEWNAMTECQAELNGLVRQHSRQGYPVVMAKCHYVMDGPSGAGWQVAGRFSQRYHGF
ncbi:MAG TPA: hypothetical protein VHG92_13310 [Afifellaceae bacterium]|nr:hypothetical protein [Afifellaceae bacterium]